MTNAPVSFTKIKDGDTAEFERMFRLYYKRLCIYADSIIKNSADAEEIVCDIFTHIWEKRLSTNITVSLEAYLYSCVYHEAINYIKHAAVEERYREKMADRMAAADLFNCDEHDTPLSDVLENERHEWIEKAIGSLPPQCRQVFMLHQIEGLSYEEVARQLNVSINTVRTQITRATRKLRTALLPLYTLGKKR